MADSELSTLSAEVGKLLLRNHAMLTLAESCTGGMVASLITEIAGSSQWFDSGLVTYSNASKQALLNVSAETLANHGAVSEETAREMALGALSQGRATISASITGIAGPDGGTPQKPVGTVSFAWASSTNSVIVCTHHLQGNRQQIREQSARIALQGVAELLSKQLN